MIRQAIAGATGTWAGEVELELRSILGWWMQHSFDAEREVFVGEIDASDRRVPGAHCGVVLLTRLLWFFSATALHLRDPQARSFADQAARELRRKFIDPVHGGVFWTIDPEGRPADTKKQAYAQAFAIYALCAHYAATYDERSLLLAKAIFKQMEMHYFDRERGGYLEATSRSWTALSDVRLGDKDANFPKTMNTHLHILEAYGALHAAVRSRETEAALARIIALMIERFYDSRTARLRLFFEIDWTDRSEAVSFGHNIEASWLIWEACEALGDTQLSVRAKPIVRGLAQACLRDAVGADGGIWNERHTDGRIDHAHVWWVQAEAMVGFLNAYELSSERKYFEASKRVWEFIKRHQRDPRGEWSWYSNIDRIEGPLPYKAGMWKCPYHNGRAMIEVARRMQRLQEHK